MSKKADGVIGAIVGGFTGLVVGGPAGMAVGIAIGGALGEGKTDRGNGRTYTYRDGSQSIYNADGSLNCEISRTGRVWGPKQ